ncbi:MAG: glycosyltransferase family 2 protein, partial [Natrialbaceae archaeon]
VIETLPAFVDRAYVIDDRSTDGTWEEIERAAGRVNELATAEYDRRLHADGGLPSMRRVVPIRHERNRGVGGAIKTGYERAAEDGLDVVAVMNGDGQMDPGILDRIIDPFVDGRADYAKGNRLSRRDHREAMPAWRLFGNGLLTFLTKFVSGYWRMNDPQNGYTAISKRALEAIDLGRLYEGYGFCNDLLVHLNVHGLRIEDVEMRSRYGDERSHIRYSSFVPSLSWLLLRRALWRYKQKYVVTDFHPLVFLLGLGFVGGVAGLGYLGWSVSTAGLVSVEALVSVLIVLLAGFFLTLAMIFDRMANEPLESEVSERVGGGRV